MMFEQWLRPSSSDKLVLDDVLERLKRQPEIDAILLAGTTGKETLKPYSDYDLLIVLNEMVEPPSLIITTIEGKLAELYFWNAVAIDEKIENPQTVEANSLAGAFLSMVTKGKIVYDASSRLEDLRKIAPQTHIKDILDHQIYAAWYSVTYNHAQNLRYFSSQDWLYWMALQCRLLYCISNCLSAYFTLRGMPWRGEKEAIRYLQANDPAYLEQFQAAVTAGGIEQQFPQYVQLVEQTLPEGISVWGESYTAVQPQPHITTALIEKHADQWRQWIED
ncbi:MAG: nucleotidyltransferase domain-containing protein [Chloroflexota bacterium]